MNYPEFIASKDRVNVATGIEDEIICSPYAKKHQSRGVTWACRKGRALIGYNTGLGKSLMQLDISRIIIEHKGGMALILAPLAVTQQTVKEGERWGIPIKFVKTQAECTGDGIYITNYQKIDHFDLHLFTCLTIDEASILKDFTSKTTTMLLEIAQCVPFRFCFSATPSPNDFTELGNYAEFLGICTRTEMLTTYFVHDGETTQEWRLKGHAKEKFWRWLCTFMIAANLPSDVCGCESDCHCDDGYILPEARIHEHIIECAEAHEGQLFPELANTLTEQRKVKKATLSIRNNACVEVVQNTHPGWIINCETNDESDFLVDALAESMPKSQIVFEMRGSLTDDQKEVVLNGFTECDDAILISKSSMTGHGLNLQQYNQIAFTNISHSAERTWQAIMRCQRFGQKNVVDVHFFLTDAEIKILRNYKRKVVEIKELIKQLVRFMAEHHDLKATRRVQDDYIATERMELPEFIRE